MAECGIEKYDKLPGRVGWKDVDAMRAALSMLQGDGWTVKLASLLQGKGIWGWPRYSIEEHRQALKDELDKAAEEYADSAADGDADG